MEKFDKVAPVEDFNWDAYENGEATTNVSHEDLEKAYDNTLNKVNDREVVDAGIIRLSVMALSYSISAFMDCTIAASRGLGKTIVPTVMVILGSCVFRIIWIYTIFAWIHTIPSLYLLYVFSWLITSAAEIIYFISSYRKLKC